ncbi:MAG: ribosome small subunit-dependent GTPase A [Woeseiaceae bacterium]|nr:ribosome small subunit-dependent GTPase A [Woeseiaceae bacterium]
MTAMPATVIATYSRRMRVRLGDGTTCDARIKGKKLKPVCGDSVATELIVDEDDLLITAILERRNQLTRTNLRGKKEVLAANVDKLIVVAAATPKPDWFVVDRYLCAAELMNVAGVVVFNKEDLGIDTAARQALDVFEKLGYLSICTSAENDHNIAALADLVGTGLAIIVGQSGVGKSTLINRISAGNQQKTASISSKHREGRHTTVNSVMIATRNGGAIIDSPGVRDYAPMLESVDDVKHGFREVRETGQRCRFANCRHLKEPGCAVKTAVDSGDIDARRYESYRRAVFLAENINRDRY